MRVVLLATYIYILFAPEELVYSVNFKKSEEAQSRAAQRILLVLQELDFIFNGERAAYSLGYYDTYTRVRGKHSSHAYLKINTLYAP